MKQASSPMSTVASGPPLDPASAFYEPKEWQNREAIVVVVACFICMGLSFAPVFMGTFPLFFEPVSRDLHWSASTFPQAMLISGLTGALSGPLVGRLIDTLGVRKVLLPGLLAWAATLAAMSFLNGSVVMLYVISAFMGPLAATCGPVALAKVVSTWFDRSRGVALSVVLGGSAAISTAAMLPLARSLILEFGWRNTYLVLAALIVLIGWPLSYLFVRESRRESIARLDIPGPVAVEITPMAAFTSRAYWTVILASCLVCASCAALAKHFIPWAAERGMSSLSATFALSLFSLAGPFSAVIAGAAADRSSHPGMLAFVFAVPLLGFGIMLTSHDWAIVTGLTLMGAGFAAVAGLLPFFTSRYFGLANASTIFGVSIGLVTVSMGVGPVVFGVLRDKWGSYMSASPVVEGVLCLGVLLAATLPRYPVNRGTAGEVRP
ncbi:MFS transporter [Burkholderia cenocepacia]|uniref:MFS transporter n=2 Tax=Burkholderia cepacia complex TaxID=87882 RepID=UPI000AB75F23|nr:MFS transporter [Burkholderia cenocepacia]MDN7681574.1 MFS transporter [Burkholderia cenocepacia]